MFTETENTKLDIKPEVTASDLSEFVYELVEEHPNPDKLGGAETQKLDDIFTVPLILTLRSEVRSKKYRRADISAELMLEQSPAKCIWADVGLRTTLAKAFEMYGDDLIGYEQVYKVSMLEILGQEVRKHKHQNTRVLIRQTVIV